VKLQGQNGLLDLVRMRVAQIITENEYAEGLYFTEAVECHIGSYSGYHNGHSGNQRDINLQTGKRNTIGQITSVECGCNNGPTVVIQTAWVDYQIGRIVVHNCDFRGVQVGSGGYGTIDSVIATDDRSTPNMITGFRVTNASATGRLGCFKTNLANDTATDPRITITPAGNYNYEVGRVELGSTDTLEGVVDLTNGATSTSVACGHIFDVFVGTATTDHYFHPIIQIIPWNATAMALLASGGFRTTTTRNSTGTGFTIHHPTAGASDLVFWKVLGWKQAAREQL
jgi:hypothetical protein